MIKQSCDAPDDRLIWQQTTYKIQLKVNNFPFNGECKDGGLNFEKIIMFSFNRLAS